mgnify:CR=1 FL=1
MIQSPWIRWNRLFAGIVLVFSFFTYFFTMSPTVSFWDCGEFIATSYTLGVPHPPGSPLYLIIGRIFSMLPFNPDIAFRVNLISPLVSSLAVMLLYLVIVKFAAHWRDGIKNKSDAIIAFGGALIGSLTFAFTDSHWFNAVEAEVYAMSTFFTVIVVWLILHWSERADHSGNERYILIIAYMIGLASGIHILNLLTLPFVALIIYFKKLPFSWKTFLITIGITGLTFLVIHNGIIKGLPKLAVVIGLTGVCISVLIIFGAMIWAINERRRLLSIIFTSMVLILIGYSSYTIIFIRSGQDPVIDENDPETIASAISYLEREQYGSVGRFPRRYKGLPPQHEVVGYPKNGEYTASQKRKYMLYNTDKQWTFFWNYQVKKMYWRYFLWQFAGRGESSDDRVTAMGANSKEDGVDWTQFGFPLALILGIGGMFYHFYRDEKQAFSLFTLFFMTGLAVIVYLNQDNPQPRERDYSYVGSFLAFAVWVGIGGSAILEKCLSYFKSHPWRHHLAYLIVGLQLMLVPFVMLRANYREHDRSGNFVAWDMSYNMLQSCEPDGIIFTNGDNDTFPLWYLQEVEGIRKDVTVANLSLLNTAWYIKQLRDLRPREKRFIFLNDDDINKIASRLNPWKTRNVTLPYKTEKQITWKVKPTYGGQALKVQDMMVLQIINDTRWKYPIYFAVTVSPSNKLGLDNYLTMEGLTFKLNDHKVDNIDPDKMYDYLMTELGDSTWHNDFSQISSIPGNSDPGTLNWSDKYQPGYLFRNLGNEDVHFNDQIIRLLQNYRSAYLQLAVHHYYNYQNLKGSKETKEEAERERKTVLAVLDQMSLNLPEKMIPIPSNDLYYQIGHIYSQVGQQDRFRSILDELSAREGTPLNDKIRFGQTYIQELKDYDKAINIFEEMNDYYRSLEESFRKNPKSVSAKSWKKWETVYPEIISSLVLAYQGIGDDKKAEAVLNDWLDRNPMDNTARKMLEELKE